MREGYPLKVHCLSYRFFEVASPSQRISDLMLNLERSLNELRNENECSLRIQRIRYQGKYDVDPQFMVGHVFFPEDVVYVYATEVETELVSQKPPQSAKAQYTPVVPLRTAQRSSSSESSSFSLKRGQVVRNTFQSNRKVIPSVCKPIIPIFTPFKPVPAILPRKEAAKSDLDILRSAIEKAHRSTMDQVKKKPLDMNPHECKFIESSQEDMQMEAPSESDEEVLIPAESDDAAHEDSDHDIAAISLTDSSSESSDAEEQEGTHIDVSQAEETPVLSAQASPAIPEKEVDLQSFFQTVGRENKNSLLSGLGNNFSPLSKQRTLSKPHVALSDEDSFSEASSESSEEEHPKSVKKTSRNEKQSQDETVTLPKKQSMLSSLLGSMADDDSSLKKSTQEPSSLLKKRSIEFQSSIFNKHKRQRAIPPH